MWIGVFLGLLAVGLFTSGYLALSAIVAGAASLALVGTPRGATDMVTFTPMQTDSARTYVSIFKYENPRSFKDFVFVYDPASAYFDAYSVQVSYNRWVNPYLKSGRQTDKGSLLPADPSKKALFIYSNYTRPSESTSKYINSITLQCFYLKRQDANEHREYLARFDKLRESAEFRKYSSSTTFERIPKTGASWKTRPDIHRG